MPHNRIRTGLAAALSVLLFASTAFGQSAVQMKAMASGLIASVISCDRTIVYDNTTNGSTQLVALTANQTIFICGYTIVAGGTVNVKLIYGTGSACATGSTNMTPAYQLVAQAGVNDASSFYRGLKTAVSNALCINSSAGVAVQAIVYYTKY